MVEEPSSGTFGPPEGLAVPEGAPSRTTKSLVLIFLALWLAFQVLFPLRHLLYPGYVSWTEEGHKFSWQMKLRDKEGTALFFVRDPATGREWKVEPRIFLLPHQVRKMVKRPDMIVQFAHHLADIWARQRGIEGVEVRVRACISLNGRKEALLVDPQRDLARVELSLRQADWILPLKHPPARPPLKRGRRALKC